MSRTTLVTFAVLGLLGLAVLIAWGGAAFVVYLFFAGIALAVVFGARVGGEWLQNASRGRFDRDDR